MTAEEARSPNDERLAVGPGLALAPSLGRGDAGHAALAARLERIERGARGTALSGELGEHTIKLLGSLPGSQVLDQTGTSGAAGGMGGPHPLAALDAARLELLTQGTPATEEQARRDEASCEADDCQGEKPARDRDRGAGHRGARYEKRLHFPQPTTARCLCAFLRFTRAPRSPAKDHALGLHDSSRPELPAQHLHATPVHAEV